MSDYTLPPLVLAISGNVWIAHELEAWGQQCAEAARAPLLARIAVLEAAHRGLDAYKRALSSRVGELEADNARLRRKVMAQNKRLRKESGDA